MSTERSGECCPRFDPAPWDGQEHRWQERLFVKDRVRSVLSIPLNFGRVMTRNLRAIEAAGAGAESPLVLSDETSRWGADVYIAVSREVPGAEMATISGTFLSKAFEGSYKEMGAWIEEMKAHVEREGRRLQKLYFFYTTCPRCVKKYGENYVVILAQV